MKLLTSNFFICVLLKKLQVNSFVTKSVLHSTVFTTITIVIFNDMSTSAYRLFLYIFSICSVYLLLGLLFVYYCPVPIVKIFT